MIIGFVENKILNAIVLNILWKRRTKLIITVFILNILSVYVYIYYKKLKYIKNSDFLVLDMPKSLESILNQVKKVKYRNVSNCDPINNNPNQYTVNIDGVVYPQYVSLHFDRRINFDCLNKNKKLKKILFWNKFYGKLKNIIKIEI